MPNDGIPRDAGGMPKGNKTPFGLPYYVEKEPSHVYEKIAPINDGHVHGTGAADGAGFDSEGGTPMGNPSGKG